MRVALVCPYAWDDPGGVQVHVRELALELQGRGHDVIALAPRRHRVDEPWVRAVGRPVDLRYNRSSAPIDPRPWSARRTGAELDRFRPDVVHAHEPLTPSTSMWATLTARVPVVATFHSNAERSLLFDLAAPALRRVARRLSARIAVSQAAADFARRRLGGAFEVVPNGVHLERFGGAEPAELGPGKKMLFVGRLDERKGFRIAVQAFGLLAVDRADLRLIVVGDGPEVRAVDTLPPKLRDRVTLLGPIENRDLPPVHAACDMYLGPSVGGESFGIVLVEAMAAGLPVVASDIPGYDEIVRDGIDGSLVPARDARALATAAARVLDDAGLSESLRVAGRRRAEAFSWTTVVPRIEAIYDRVTGVARSSR